MTRMLTIVVRAVEALPRGHGGQGMAEYGLILALVALVAVAAVTILGTNVGSTLTSIAGSI